MAPDGSLNLAVDAKPHLDGLRAERLATNANLQNLNAFVRTVRANSGGMADPVRYLRNNSAKLTQMFNQACVDSGPCPAHLTGIQASDFALGIAELDAAAGRWAARMAGRGQ